MKTFHEWLLEWQYGGEEGASRKKAQIARLKEIDQEVYEKWPIGDSIDYKVANRISKMYGKWSFNQETEEWERDEAGGSIASAPFDLKNRSFHDTSPDPDPKRLGKEPESPQGKKLGYDPLYIIVGRRKPGEFDPGRPLGQKSYNKRAGKYWKEPGPPPPVRGTTDTERMFNRWEDRPDGTWEPISDRPSTGLGSGKEPFEGLKSTVKGYTRDQLREKEKERERLIQARRGGMVASPHGFKRGTADDPPRPRRRKRKRKELAGGRYEEAYDPSKGSWYLNNDGIIIANIPSSENIIFERLMEPYRNVI